MHSTQTQSIVLCTVFICVINLTITMSAGDSYNLSSNVNMNRKYWQQFQDSCVKCRAAYWKFNSVSALGSHILSPNVNMSRKYWQQFQDILWKAVLCVDNRT